MMAIQALSEIRSRRVVPILVAVARNSDSNLAVWSVDGLGHVGDPSVLPTLHAVLANSKDPMLRTEAAHSIVLLGDHSSDAIMVLENGLNTDIFQEATEAAIDLGDVKDNAVIGTLEHYESSDKVNKRVRIAAAVALTNYKDSAGLPLLKEAMIDEDAGRYLPSLLDHLNFEIGRPLLIGALSSSNQVLRLAATEAIGRMGGQPEILILSKSSERVQDPIELAQVAWALGRIGKPECIPLLLKLVQNPAPEVRDTAADALARTADKLGAANQASPPQA
jgi:HEAT repeat protein